jgi:hypothetical protein
MNIFDAETGKAANNPKIATNARTRKFFFTQKYITDVIYRISSNGNEAPGIFNVIAENSYSEAFNRL